MRLLEVIVVAALLSIIFGQQHEIHVLHKQIEYIKDHQCHTYSDVWKCDEPTPEWVKFD